MKKHSATPSPTDFKKSVGELRLESCLVMRRLKMACMYVIPKGSRKTFTLSVAYTPEDGAERNKYRARVTRLTFSFDGELQLNQHELQHS